VVEGADRGVMLTMYLIERTEYAHACPIWAYLTCTPRRFSGNKQMGSSVRFCVSEELGITDNSISWHNNIISRQNNVQPVIDLRYDNEKSDKRLTKNH